MDEPNRKPVQTELVQSGQYQFFRAEIEKSNHIGQHKKKRWKEENLWTNYLLYSLKVPAIVCKDKFVEQENYAYCLRLSVVGGECINLCKSAIVISVDEWGRTLLILI
jgi:hypothetical protein